MNKKQIFEKLEHEKSNILLELLRTAYDTMNTTQRQEVFGKFSKSIPKPMKDGIAVLEEVEDFEKNSLAGRYYAPFMIDSKNFMDIPDETEEWFQRLDELLESSTSLSQQREHDWAVACFQILYKLIDKMESGEEIIFADEYGSWMIPGNEKDYIAAYLTSLAETSSREGFAQETIPLLKRDSYNSFAFEVYSSALKTASPTQIRHLEAEIKRQNIRIPNSKSTHNR